LSASFVSAACAASMSAAGVGCGNRCGQYLADHRLGFLQDQAQMLGAF